MCERERERNLNKFYNRGRGDKTLGAQDWAPIYAAEFQTANQLDTDHEVNIANGSSYID